MKKLSAGIATSLCLLAAAAPGLAQQIANEFGLYTDVALTGDPAGASMTATPYEVVSVELTVINPYNFHYVASEHVEPVERAMDTVHGFALGLQTSDPDCVIVEVVPVVGSTIDYNHPYFFFFNEPVPVPDDRIVHLATISVMVFDDSAHALYFEPYENWDEPESMLLFDGAWNWLEWDYCAAYPSSGSYYQPVFGFGKTVVATDEASWDEVKALYR